MRHRAAASATRPAAASCPIPTSDLAPTPVDPPRTATWETEYATPSLAHSSILLSGEENYAHAPLLARPILDPGSVHMPSWP
eukprot:7008528-Pyramimonas_sp.AAC.1